jgi:ribosomal protein S18 acetylase RimI-like enzyme
MRRIFIVKKQSYWYNKIKSRWHMVEIKIIQYLSSEYKEALILRDNILRKPLGRNIYDEDLKKESDDIHLVAFFEGKIEGTLILRNMGDGKVKMLQVAVTENMRNRGIGRKLVEESEKIAREKGYRKIVLNARRGAVEFYKRLDYEIVSEEFMEVGISHFRMQKRL